VGISAIVRRSNKIEAKAKKVAAHMMEVAEGDVVLSDGKFTVSGTDKSCMGDVALNAYIAHKFSGQELEARAQGRGFLRPDQFYLSGGFATSARWRSIRKPVTARLSRGTAVDDFGTVVNPMIVEGQVHGGNRARRGSGAARTGPLRQGRPADHRLLHGLLHAARPGPAGAEHRNDRNEIAIHPLGIKAAGEAGAIAAPVAVINALTDAIGSEEIGNARNSSGGVAGTAKEQLRRKRHRSSSHVRIHSASPDDAAAAANLLAKQEEAKASRRRAHADPHHEASSRRAETSG